MIFHEKLKLKFDVDAMRDEMVSVQQRLGCPILQGSNQEFGGWSLQSDDGDWQRGFEEGAMYEHPLEGGYVGEVAKPTHEYNKRTEACTGIFSDILDELEDKGFYPHRSRITILEPNHATAWHSDDRQENYAIRLHIPFLSNPDCTFTVRDEGTVHMPADGHAHLVDVSTLHQARNDGTSTRMHFLSQVWVTKGYSEHFVVTESRKIISSYYNMMGYYTYLKVLDEQEKG